ncbi:MAG TPA: hypothetical protein VGN79_14315 [Devosia sp.]|jgi:hypothetical protein|nr:hypothetical protein [Devosia sp.]
MTSIIFFRSDDSITSYTDGSAYDEFGIFRQKASKTSVLLHQPALVATRGSGNAGNLYDAFAGRHPTYDALCDGMADDLVQACTHAHLLFGDPINLQVTAGGFSDRTGRFEAQTMFFSLDDEGKKRPNALIAGPVDSTMVDPWPDETLMEAICAKHVAAGDGVGDEFVIEVMEAQRATKYTLHPPPNNHTKGCLVGAFIQKTVLMRDDAYTRIIHRWPDEIGQKLGRELEPDK